jgi:hypothetical protein
MCFVQTPEMLRLIAGEQRGQLYELTLHWQRKFVDRHLAHDNLGGSLSDTESRRITDLITSKLRQSVK